MPKAPIVDARRRVSLAGLALAVLALHGWLIGGVPIAWPGAAAPRPAPVVEARRVELPAPPVALAAPEPMPTPPLAPATPRPRPRTTPPAVAAVTPPPPAEPAPTMPEPPAQEGDVPLYRALPPPPATLRYEMTLGRLAGSGTLAWQVEDGRYRVAFDGQVAGLPMLRQASEGALDGHGLQPERFTDRRRRGERAVSFDGDRVSFSGPSTVLDRHTGMQDRLSWLLQLSAVLAAEPRRLAEGESVSLHVIGPRGDAGVWVLRSAGPETVETPAGPLAAVRFRRDARGPFDTEADAWLAAEPPHWPLRLRMSNGTDAGLFELLLQARP